MSRKFVFGDIHGCLVPLKENMDYIFANESFDNKNDSFIFIGDYVDRGPKSKQVIDLLIQLKKDYPDTVFLRGNHEDMMMDYLGLGGSYGNMFLYNGGSSTLDSYNLFSADEFDGYHDMVDRPEEYERTQKIVRERFPEDHYNFLKSTQLYHDTPDILFVHAGLNPYRPLEEQTPFDFLWVQDNRDRFFNWMARKPWHKLMVHGHTPDEPDKVKKHAKKNRINVDTGFVYGGRLTCLVIDSDVETSKWKMIQHDGDEVLIRY